MYFIPLLLLSFVCPVSVTITNRVNHTAGKDSIRPWSQAPQVTGHRPQATTTRSQASGEVSTAVSTESTAEGQSAFLAACGGC